jgi:hypothetical protein
VHASATALLLALLLAVDDQPTVPVELQAELLAKVLRYDRSYTARASEGATVLIVHLDEPGSAGVARQLLAALQAQPALGGVGHREELVRWTTTEALVELVRKRHADVVVFAPGLATQATALSTAFDGVAALTVSTTPQGVREGLVLGFDLVSGRPRMLFNLGQARRQRADFRAEVLQLMTVYP